MSHVWDQDLSGAEQSQNPGHWVHLDPDRVSPQVQDRAGHQGPSDFNHNLNQHQDQNLNLNQNLNQNQHLNQNLNQHQDQDQNLNLNQHQNMDQDQAGAAASQEAVGESGGSGGGGGGGVPELVITQAEEPPAAELHRAQRPADLLIPVIPVIPVVSRDPILSSSSDGGDVSSCDLLSLRSDSLSLASESEPTISRMSEDDDNRSVTASSVMSLFHRLQLDPLEKDWMRSSAVGNMAAQRRLLARDSSLVLKKDFVTTALHWAAKQGRQDAVDLMLRFGADVNARSHGGYTPLHLASIHGHQHVVLALIHTHNAKTSIRDYHGKMAVHYWSGCRDVFNQPDSQSGARFCRGRRTQRFVLPSLLLSRSRSQGQLSLEFGPPLPPPSATQEALDLQV